MHVPIGRGFVHVGVSLIVACISAAIAASILLTVFTALADNRSFATSLPLMAFYLPFAAAASIFIGLPIFAILNLLKSVNFWSAGFSGLLVGFLCGLSLNQPAYIALLVALIGGLSGLTFWFVWRLGIGQKSAIK